jgi:hypothetical protein
MAQSLEVNIKTTSDVPQATDKAKAAMNGFGKQIDDIQKKFGTSFKDIFLSFLGPMAILTTVLAVIGKMIADNQKKHEEANRAAIDGTNELMSAEDRYYANKRNNEKKAKEQIEEAKTSREDITADFLSRGVKQGDKQISDLVYAYADKARKEGKPYGISAMSQDKAIQDKVQAMIAEEAKKNPIEPKGQNAPTGFKGPEGFGNVVGVGANPVMEAMTLQLEEARKQTQLLEEIRNGNGGGVPTDFTKPQPLNAASRSGSI